MSRQPYFQLSKETADQLGFHPRYTPLTGQGRRRPRYHYHLDNELRQIKGTTVTVNLRKHNYRLLLI